MAWQLPTSLERVDKSIRSYDDLRTLLQRSERVRGDDEQSGHLFRYLSPEQRVPASHPLRAIRRRTDDALRRLSPRFEAMYANIGRPSIPPELLLRALLLQVLYSVRSERMLMEQLGEVLMENRHGLVVDACVVPATGTGERDAAISLIAASTRDHWRRQRL